jgi:hypothetical protein
VLDERSDKWDPGTADSAAHLAGPIAVHLACGVDLVFADRERMLGTW